MSHDPTYINEILDLLHQTKKAHTITDISKILGHDRRTISNILNQLLLTGKVEMRHHGQKKKYYLTESDTKNQIISTPANFLIVLNPNLTLRWANEESIRITELSMNTLKGKRLEALNCPIINNFAIISHISSLQKGKTCTFEQSIIAGGVTLTYLYSLAYISISASDQVIILSGQDITEIKQIEQKIINHEQQLNLLTQNIPGAVFRRYLPENRVEFFNSLFQVFAGHLSPKSAWGYLNSIDAYIHPDDRENYINTLQLSLATETEYEVEYRIKTRQGHYGYLLERGRPVKDTSGNQIYVDGFILDITDRKNTERILQESEERFRLLADLAPVGIYITDYMGACRFANREWCRQTGLTPSEAAGRGWIIGIHADDYEMIAAKSDGSDFVYHQPGYQYSFLSKNGAEIWVHTTTAELRDENGELVGYIGCNTDITEKKQLEEEIREGGEKFRTLFENMITGVYYQRSDGILTDVNSSALEIFGLTREQFLGTPSEVILGLMIHENGSDFRESDHPAIGAFRCGIPVRNVIAGIFNPVKNGYVWVSINAIPEFRPGEYEPAEVFVTLHEISDILERDNLLTEKRSLLHAIFTVTNVSIFVIDLSGKIIRANPAFSALYGYDDEEISQIHIDQIIHPDDIQVFHILIRGMREGSSSSIQKEIRSITKNKSVIWIDLSVVPIPDNKRRPSAFIFVVKDITLRKNTEHNLEESEEKFRLAAQNSPGILFRCNMYLREVEFYSDINPISLGYHPDDLFRTDDLSKHALLHPKDWEELNSARLTALKTEGEYEIIYQIRGHYGRIHTLLERGKAVGSASDNSRYITGIILDTTQKQQFQEVLRHQAERYLQSREFLRDLSQGNTSS